MSCILVCILFPLTYPVHLYSAVISQHHSDMEKERPGTARHLSMQETSRTIKKQKPQISPTLLDMLMWDTAFPRSYHRKIARTQLNIKFICVLLV
jgi:hypothetical protein